MFDVLLESGAHETGRPARWTAASAFVHAALMASAVIATVRDAPRPIESVAVRPVHYVVPRESVVPRPQHESTISGSIGWMLRELPTIPVPFIPTENPIVATGEELAGPMSFGPDSANGTAGASDLPGNGIYHAAHVDRTVMPRAENPHPEYPNTLRAAGLEGEVQVRFVVDSVGSVEPTSIEIVRATHPQFAAVVRQWLPRTRYVPAEARGRRVRQLVEQRVGFTLRP